MNEAGVDEAGRGPVLGPLVIAGVVLPPSEIEQLVNKGLTDSKSLSSKKREELYELILDVVIDQQIVILEPSEIDARVSQSISLNKLELMNMVKVLSSMKHWSTAYVDACDVNAERFQLILQSELQATINGCSENERQAHPILQNQLQTKIIAEHGADLKYPVVSAASVIAKVIRDREIEKARKEFDFDFGSGYPNDPKTNRFLVNYYSSFGELPKIARKSWETSKRLVRFFEQSKLDEFFKLDLRKKI